MSADGSFAWCFGKDAIWTEEDKRELELHVEEFVSESFLEMVNEKLDEINGEVV